MTSAASIASASDVQDAVRTAAATSGALRIVGAGSWLDAGRPVQARDSVVVAGLRGITEYVPGDLTLTAGAGTTLDEIGRATSAEGQWLALDPFGDPGGTLGATIATASAGPLAHAFGTPRDIVLGLEIVLGTGALVRAGGRVVKNVAGFDLARVMIGAWGTLGVLTEATVRLRPLPEVDRTIALAVPDDSAPLAQLLDRIRSAAVAPLALELINEALATSLGVGKGSVLLARLGGNGDDVSAQLAVFESLGDAAAVDSAVWQRLTTSADTACAAVRLSTRPTNVAELWAAALRAAAAHGAGRVHATPERGIVRVLAPPAPDDALDRWIDALSLAPGTRIAERLPPGRWREPFTPAIAADRTSVALRARFDPAGVFNAGILGPHV